MCGTVVWDTVDGDFQGKEEEVSEELDSVWKEEEEVIEAVRLGELSLRDDCWEDDILLAEFSKHELVYSFGDTGEPEEVVDSGAEDEKQEVTVECDGEPSTGVETHVAVLFGVICFSHVSHVWIVVDVNVFFILSHGIWEVVCGSVFKLGCVEVSPVRSECCICLAVFFHGLTCFL